MNGQRSMASTVDTSITAIVIFVLFERGPRTLMKHGSFRMQTLTVCRCHVALHGMGAFEHAIDRHGQHDQEEKLGKEFIRN